MPGFDQAKLVDLAEREANTYECSICLNIYNNAVMSKQCGHTFCRECLQHSIEDHKKYKCPECRKEFTRKRGNDGSNLVTIGRYVFIPNFKINKIIGQLKTKCDFESNGCEERVKLESLLAHLLVCEHRPCTNCLFKAGNPETHNCVELLKKDRDEFKNKLQLLQSDQDDLKNKFENSKKIIKDTKKQNLLLHEQVNKYKTKSKERKIQCNEETEINAKLTEEIDQWKLNYHQSAKQMELVKDEIISLKKAHNTKFEKLIEDMGEKKQAIDQQNRDLLKQADEFKMELRNWKQKWLRTYQEKEILSREIDQNKFNFNKLSEINLKLSEKTNNWKLKYKEIDKKRDKRRPTVIPMGWTHHCPNN